MAVQLYLALGPLHFGSTRVGSVTRVLMVQIQRFSDFLKAWKETFQMVSSKFIFERLPIWLYHG